MKNIILTFFIILFSSIAYSQNYSFGGGSGTKSDPYKINNRAQLEELRNWLGEKYKDMHYRLENDIDLSGKEWIPIGEYSRDHRKAFRGKLDGNGKKIKEIQISQSYQNSGLFGYLYNGAYIEDVHIVGGQINNKHDNSSGSYTGSIAGRTYCNPLSGNDSICIISCTSSAEIINTSGNYSYIGGIIGNSDGISGGKIIMRDCVNYGNITGNTSELSKLGGIIGDAFGNLNMQNCMNYGNLVTCSNLGGIIGSINGYGTGKISIDYCSNYGNIKNNIESNVGGLVGIIIAIGSSNIAIINSYSHSNIETSGEKLNIGGIAGCLRITANSSADITIDKTYSYGKIISGKTETKIGGLVGFIDRNSGNINIKNSISALESITGDANKTHRIAGTSSEKYGTNIILGNNYAVENMTVNQNTLNITDSNHEDGANIAFSDIFSKNAYTKLGWDFQNIWDIRNDNLGLAYFKWQSAPVKIENIHRNIIKLNIYRPSYELLIYRENIKNPLDKVENITKEISEYNVNLINCNAGDVVSFINYETGKKASYPTKSVVKPSVITVTADPKILCQGDEELPLTYTVEPELLPGENLNGSLERDSGSEIGEYTIHKGTLNSKNYIINFVEDKYTILGRLEITKQPNPVIYIYPNTPELRLYVEATDSRNIYKWYKNGVEIPGVYKSELIIKNPTASNVGIYHVEVIGLCNTAFSVKTKVEYHGNTNPKMEE